MTRCADADRVRAGNEPVIIQDGVESVRDGQHGALFELGADRVLDEIVRLQVDRRRRLVQNQNLGFAQQSSGQAQQLPLTDAGNETVEVHVAIQNCFTCRKFR